MQLAKERLEALVNEAAEIYEESQKVFIDDREFQLQKKLATPGGRAKLEKAKQKRIKDRDKEKGRKNIKSSAKRII